MNLLKRILHNILFCTFMLPAAAHADQSPIPGEDDPAYLSAVESWLNGDDLPALQALTDLSHNGNTAAQILLARIADDAPLHAHVTSSMNRRDRVALLKMPGGLSGKSWMNVAEEQSELASLLQNSRRLGQRLDSISGLFSIGETTMAIRVATAEYHSGKFAEVRQILNQETYLPDAAIPSWRLFNPVDFMYTYDGPPASHDLINRAQELPDTYEIQMFYPRYREFLAGDPNAFEEVKAVATAVPTWAPLTGFCERHCPDDVDACVAVAGVTSNLQGPIFPFSSPSERLIPNERYWNSPRMDGDVVRKSRDFRRFPDFLTELNSCLPSTLARLQTEMDLPQ